MKVFIYQWVKKNIVMVANTGSLVATTGITSVLGFAYWWYVARAFPPEAVGLASAAISAMTLLGTVSMLGLGTLLLGELPRQPGNESSLIVAALAVVGCLGGGLGVLFAIVAPLMLTDLKALGADFQNIALFALGVSFTAVTLVLDEALIGLLRGEVQFWRNTTFAVAKLVTLYIVSLWLANKGGLTIFTTWTVGNILSLVVLAGLLLKERGLKEICAPQWRWLRKMGSTALLHHAFNLTLLAPYLILPLLVTATLSATTNAWFYISLGIASLANVLPLALTVVLYAEGSAQPAILAYKARLTLSLALVATILATCILLPGANQILALFGRRYVEEAAWNLRILTLVTFPLIIIDHYVAVCRVQRRIISALLPMAAIGTFQLICAAVGAHLYGLSGLSLGILAADCIGALFLFPTIYKVLRATENAAIPAEISSQN